MSSTEEDRISALPDSLISHILSFLPTKLTLATSILSKRWTLLWQSVSTLHFDDDTFQDFASFRHFVYSVMLSRDPFLPLQSFRIRCGKSIYFNPHDLYRFVHAAVQRRIEVFDLDISDGVFYLDLMTIAPTIVRVLSCKTLVVLKLANLGVYDLPHLIYLPLLKTLHLDTIYFLCHFQHFRNFVQGCPNLEDLYINYVDLPEMCHELEGEIQGFPKLITANLGYSEEDFPFAWVHNAKFLRAELRWIYEYRIPTFHNLTHMELIFNSNSWDGKWKWVVKVLQHCPKLQNLTINEGSDYVPVARDKEWKYPKIIPECLLSQLKTCSLSGYKGYECELQFAEYIMLNSKLLCTMTIKSNCVVDENAKYQMLVKLSSYSRGSVTCKLLFD